jgi:hypothetical protein
MAELEQDAAAALLPPPAAGVAPTLLLLELSLAHPASPALAASTAIAAIAATVICLIPALLVLARKIKRIIIPNGRPRALAPQPAPASSPPCAPPPPNPGPTLCAIAPVAGDNDSVAREARMALMFLNGDGMRGGRAHYTIEGVPLVGERRTAPLYRFFSVRDEFPALYPVAEGGQPILGELYDVPMGPLNALLATEPTELELSIIELEGGELSFAMVLREAEHALGIHKDITSYGGWHAYRAAALSEAPDKRRPPL